jgi:hypothetical protein
MKERDWTKVLGWPGYQVYQKEIERTGQKAEAVGKAEEGGA